MEINERFEIVSAFEWWYNLFSLHAYGKPQKKFSFSGQSTKAFSPPPPQLEVAKRTATDKKMYKKIFFP